MAELIDSDSLASSDLLELLLKEFRDENRLMLQKAMAIMNRGKERSNQTKGSDWRMNFRSMIETVAEAKMGMFVDVRFLVGQPSSARYFNAHKVMLACGSPVFEAMFFGQLAEKNNPIVIPDDDPEAFEIMLQYLHGECIVFPSILVACKSFSIADKYFISELQIKCADYIQASAMDDVNFWAIIEGNLLNNEFVRQKFGTYVELNTEKLIKSEKFLQVPEDVILIFLFRSKTDVSEYQLLCSVTKWCLKKFWQNIMSKARNFLQYIRFSVLTPTEFCLYVENFPTVLDSSDTLKILKHLVDPSRYYLPAWCSIYKVARTPTKLLEPAPLPSNVPLYSTQYARQCVLYMNPIRVARGFGPAPTY